MEENRVSRDTQADLDRLQTHFERAAQAVMGGGSNTQAARDVLALRDALAELVRVIDRAGLSNLSSGVQLGPIVWYVKASDAMDSARSALAAQPAASTWTLRSPDGLVYEVDAPATTAPHVADAMAKRAVPVRAKVPQADHG